MTLEESQQPGVVELAWIAALAVAVDMLHSLRSCLQQIAQMLVDGAVVIALE